MIEEGDVPPKQIMEKFNLKKSTFYYIRREASNIKEFAKKVGEGSAYGCRRKIVNYIPHEKVVVATYNWYLEQVAAGALVRGIDIRRAADRYAKHFKDVKFKASYVWLYRFKKKFNIGRLGDYRGESTHSKATKSKGINSSICNQLPQQEAQHTDDVVVEEQYEELQLHPPLIDPQCPLPLTDSQPLVPISNFQPLVRISDFQPSVSSAHEPLPEIANIQAEGPESAESFGKYVVGFEEPVVSYEGSKESAFVGPNKSQPTCLTIGQELEIVEMIEENIPPKEIMKKFNLKRSSFYYIKKMSSEIKELGKNMKECFINRLNVESLKDTRYHKVDKAVYTWYMQQLAAGVFVRAADIRFAAERFAKHFNETDFKASYNWLARFRELYNIVKLPKFIRILPMKVDDKPQLGTESKCPEPTQQQKPLFKITSLEEGQQHSHRSMQSPPKILSSGTSEPSAESCRASDHSVLLTIKGPHQQDIVVTCPPIDERYLSSHGWGVDNRLWKGA